MGYDSTKDTQEHREQVWRFLHMFIAELAERATWHDESKLVEPEKSVFDRVTPLLKTLTYGSDEYKAALASMGTALRHHYENNRHHPEHFVHGIHDMTLIDLVEMYCDWCAATLRMQNGDIFKSIRLNAERFGFERSVLESIFDATARQYPTIGARKGDERDEGGVR